MKILIIGKAGQIGRCLVDAAESQALSYVATNRTDLDITNSQSVIQFFASYHDFDFVINAAAYTNVDGAEAEEAQAYASNCTAVGYLAQQAKQYDIPLIHLSTDYVFDGCSAKSYQEEDETSPVNAYGKTKRDGEEVLIELWDKHIVLRVSWIFSQYRKNFVKTIAGLCDKTNQLRVVCDQFGSPTSAASVAKIILLICKRIHEKAAPKNCWGIYHYSDFPVTNWHQFATHIVRLRSGEEDFLKKSITAIQSSEFLTQADRPQYSILNTEKIKTVFQVKQESWMPAVETVLKQTGE